MGNAMQWDQMRRLWVFFNTGLNLPWLILTKICFQQLGLQEPTGRMSPRLAFAVRKRCFIYKPSAGANSGGRVFPSDGAEQEEKDQGEMSALYLTDVPYSSLKPGLCLCIGFQTANSYLMVALQ